MELAKRQDVYSDATTNYNYDKPSYNNIKSSRNNKRIIRMIKNDNNSTNYTNDDNSTIITNKSRPYFQKYLK